MAHFELVIENGQMTAGLVGDPGETLTNEQVSAYFQMLAAHNLGQIAYGLDSIAARLEELSDVMKQID